MIRVRVDPVRNRIELKVDQAVGEADIQRVVEELAAAVKTVKPGWIMVSDFRGLTLIDPSLNPYIVKIQQTVRAASPRKIGVLFDDRLVDLQLRMGADTANSQDVTRRFTDEQEWLAYIEGP